MTVFTESIKDMSPYSSACAVDADERLDTASLRYSTLLQPTHAALFYELIQPSTSSPPAATAPVDALNATFSVVLDTALSTEIQAAAIRKEMEFSQRMLLNLLATLFKSQHCQPSISEILAVALTPQTTSSTSVQHLVSSFETSPQVPSTTSTALEAAFQIEDVAMSSNSKNKLGRAYNPGRPLSMQDRQQILRLYQRGLKVSHIAKIIGVTHSCVSKIMSRYRKTGSMRPRSGQPLLFSRLDQQRRHDYQQLKQFSSSSTSSISSSSSPILSKSMDQDEASSVHYTNAAFK